MKCVKDTVKNDLFQMAVGIYVSFIIHCDGVGGYVKFGLDCILSLLIR